MSKRVALLVVGVGTAVGLVLPLHPLTTWQQRATADIKTAAPVVVKTQGPAVEEDNTLWNCFTMGNLDCGPMKRVTQELGDALSEGDDATNASDYPWESCVYDAISVMCPDGRVVTL